MALYQERFQRLPAGPGDPLPESLARSLGTAAARGMTEAVADAVVSALDEVCALPPALPASCREAVYEWLALMPGFRTSHQAAFAADLRRFRAAKEANGLL